MVRFNPQANTYAKTQVSKSTSTGSTTKTGDVQKTGGNNNTVQPQGWYINNTDSAVTITYRRKNPAGEWNYMTLTIQAREMYNMGEGTELVFVQ